MAGLSRFSRRLGSVPRPAAAVAALLWMGLVFFLSAQPMTSFGTGSRSAAWFHNLCHAPEYAMLTLLVLAAVRERGAELASSRPVVTWVLAFVAVHALLDEFHQSFTPGRDASVLDAVTDLTAGFAVVHGLRALRSDDPRRLRDALLVWVPACMLAAALATFAPALYPDATWL